MYNYKVYLKDILECIDRIEEYTKSMDYNEFVSFRMAHDAVIRNLEVIGEAVKNLPVDIKNKKPNIEWRKIAGFRDVLIHDYANIDLEIVWDVVRNSLPGLKQTVNELFEEK